MSRFHLLFSISIEKWKNFGYKDTLKKNQLVLKIYDIDVPLFTSDACRISLYRYHK